VFLGTNKLKIKFNKERGNDVTGTNQKRHGAGYESQG
jgi:hypothetical protein